MTDPIYDPATLVALREAAGFTSTEVATITGIRGVVEVESGVYTADIETLRCLCLLYRVSLACAFLPADDVRARFTGRRWTSVDEALPDVGERVLVWSRHLGVQVAHRVDDGHGPIPRKTCFNMGPVTRWMRPEPPEVRS